MSTDGEEVGAPEPGEARSRRPPWRAFREALDAVGFRPSKTRGQNFLIDPNATRALARDAAVGPGDFVLEVGPGSGFLTLELVDLGVELVAVEIDERLLEVARSFLAETERVRLIHADVLASKHRLASEVDQALPESGDWHLVSNLPYSIAGPLLVVLARRANPPRTMSVLMQDEVTRRIVAEPDESAWGALTARLALTYRRRRGRSVSPNLFWPRPRVASSVAHLERERELPEPDTLAAYDALVEGLFQRRRKTLSRALRGILGGRPGAEAEVALALAEAGLDPGARPATLGPAELLALCRAPSWPGCLPD